MYKNILIPTDGSPLSRKAAANGTKLANLVGAKVTGFYAAPPATPLEHARDIEEAAAEYLSVIDKAAKAAGVPCETVSVTNDFPADAIIAAAKKHGCDLIFIASHGRHGFKDSMLGTQTQKVLEQSPVPVLVDR